MLSLEANSIIDCTLEGKPSSLYLVLVSKQRVGASPRQVGNDMGEGRWIVLLNDVLMQGV